MKILRKVLFYIFFVLYLVLCPLIIFYALGYIFTPKAEEAFVKTGLIHIETLPANASLSIAARRYGEKTPATIRNLLAGVYDVRVTLSGYRPWTRKAKVKPGKAVTFENVLLVPQKLKVRTLGPAAFEDLWPVPGTRYLLLKGSDRAGGLKVFDWKDEAVRTVLPEGDAFANAKLERVFMAKESTWVLLQVKASEGVKFLACPLDKDKPEVGDLSSLFSGREPREVLWEGNRPDYLFALYDQDLARLDLEKMTALPGFLEKVRGFGLFKGKVYALRGTSLARLNFNARPGEEAVVEKGVFLENLFQGNGIFTIDFLSNKAICFRGERGELFSNALPYRFVDEGVRGYQPDAEGRKIVLWQEGRLGVLDFEKPERKKEFFERGPEIEWVLEKGENLRQAYFVYGAAYALYCDEDQVFLTRLGEREGLSERLLAVRENSTVFYAEKTGKLYYLEPSRGELAVAEILPEGITFSGVMSEFEKEKPGAGQ